MEEAFVRNGSVRLHVLHSRLLLTARTPLLIAPGMAEAAEDSSMPSRLLHREASLSCHFEGVDEVMPRNTATE